MYDKEYALKSRDNKEKFRNNLKVGLLIFFDFFFGQMRNILSVGQQVHN